MPIILDTPEPPGEELPPVNQVSVVEMRILPRKEQMMVAIAWEANYDVLTRIRDMNHWIRTDSYQRVVSVVAQDKESPAAAMRKPSLAPRFVANRRYTDPQNNTIPAATTRKPRIVGYHRSGFLMPSVASRERLTMLLGASG